MSKIWPNFTKQNPCPACNHWDWTCRAGDRMFVCMRVSSERSAKDGGYYHNYDDKKPIYIPTRQVVPKVNLDFEKMMEREPVYQPRHQFASSLGVSVESLDGLGASYSDEHKAWRVPMRDGKNKIIGIHLRCGDGSKRSIYGSRNGLFIPQCEPQGIAYLTEGMSNTAALLTMDFFSIGRPSCNSGGEMLKIALKRLEIKKVVIIADSDEEKKTINGKLFWPGQDGAIKLQKELNIESVIYSTPSPIKDVRQLLNKVGKETAKKLIESSVNGKVWKKNVA